ncbi:MAG: DedA family protein [Parcubacteria group bacterium]|nr:DedA family protein [Parcubacteria group bacterium]
MISLISAWALRVIDETGYAGVFVLSVLESAGIPVPSEIVVPFAGFLAQQGRFALWAVIILVSLANLMGGVGIYWLARILGRPALERFGKYVLISKHDLNEAESLFQRHGSKFVFIGRVLPVIRTFISIPAGVARMNFWKFSFYTYFGSLPWNFALALAGFKAGENWDILSPYFRKFDFVIIGLVSAAAVWYVYRHLRKLHLTHE